MLTPKDIKFIVDWAEAGNRPKQLRHVPNVIHISCTEYAVPEGELRVHLNSAGLTIAALAKALEQANAVADDLRYSPDETFGPSDELLAAFETMCRTKKELLG